MHKSRLGTLIVDCQTEDLAQAADFWGQALGAEPESRDGQTNPKYIRLNGSDNDPRVLLQQVEHESRIHIDIEADDIDAEVERLMSLGARVVERMERWVVMEAPSKHRFCVIGPIRPDFEENANVWE